MGTLEIAIDLLVEAYSTKSPFFLQEKLKEDFNIDTTLLKITNYLESNGEEIDFERESSKMEVYNFTC